jgi:esterase/lipase superfamily enzyme
MRARFRGARAEKIRLLGIFYPHLQFTCENQEVLTSCRKDRISSPLHAPRQLPGPTFMFSKKVLVGSSLAKGTTVWIAVGGLTLILAGCASSGHGGDPTAFLAFAGVQGAMQQEVPILVASTRRDDARTTGNHARFSAVSVSIPPNHRAGVIERATVGHNFAGRNFTISSVQDLTESAFLEEISARASGGEADRDILLYVHGYDINLSEARFRTAQIIVDSGFAGTPVLFTWDSISRSGLAAYEADKESATVARDELEKLILDLSNVRGVRRIHVLAHSMGAWLAMESLRAIAISGNPDLGGKLGEVMLAAPDIDLSVFSQQLSRVGAEHVTVFVSSTDRALLLSSRIAGDRPRLGALDPSNPESRETLRALGVSVYDLSRLNTDFVGHNTFAEVPSVVRQIGVQLAAGESSETDRGHFEVSEAGSER